MVIAGVFIAKAAMKYIVKVTLNAVPQKFPPTPHE